MYYAMLRYIFDFIYYMLLYENILYTISYFTIYIYIHIGCAGVPGSLLQPSVCKPRKRNPDSKTGSSAVLLPHNINPVATGFPLRPELGHNINPKP